MRRARARAERREGRLRDAGGRNEDWNADCFGRHLCLIPSVFHAPCTERVVTECGLSSPLPASVPGTGIYYLIIIQLHITEHPSICELFTHWDPPAATTRVRGSQGASWVSSRGRGALVETVRDSSHLLGASAWGRWGGAESSGKHENSHPARALISPWNIPDCGREGARPSPRGTGCAFFFHSDECYRVFIILRVNKEHTSTE